MNKKTYVFIIMILVCLLLITGTYTIVHYFFNYDADEWFRESVKDGDYVIVGQEIGDKIFDGDSIIEISIFDHINKSHMVSFKTRINNKGEKLTTNNYRIEYNEEYIKIVLIDSDNQTSAAFRFYFEDFKY